LRTWLGKRGIGALNLMAGRGRRFDDAEPKLAALDRWRRESAVELVVCSGDYTALGLEPELAAARSAVESLMDAPAGYVNVPGNHDVYVAAAPGDRRFEGHFADSLGSDLPEYRRGGPWPLVRFAGDGIAVVAVDSAHPNPQPWRSSGRIPPEQIEALSSVLRDDRVKGRYVFVVTHYAPRLRDGGPDRPLHGMVNAEDFLAACASIERGAILCGHVHHRYRVRVPGVAPPIFCAGSATMAGREGFWLFDVDATSARATAGRWNGSNYELVADSAVDA